MDYTMTQCCNSKDRHVIVASIKQEICGCTYAQSGPEFQAGHQKVCLKLYDPDE